MPEIGEIFNNQPDQLLFPLTIIFANAAAAFRIRIALHSVHKKNICGCSAFADDINSNSLYRLEHPVLHAFRSGAA